jgi:Cytochrome C oxidase, cbb3-type, subunit III
MLWEKAMNGKFSFRARVRTIGVFCALFAGVGVALVGVGQPVEASWLWQAGRGHHAGDGRPVPAPSCEFGEPEAGAWYWMRSPEQEKRVIASHYNRYCIRCHGVDGRGVWDIPDVPDFTNGRWQVSRSDFQLVRGTLEGRGACMPAFRGTLTLEEAWGMARYLRTFMPGSEASRPDRGPEEGPALMPDRPKVFQKNPSSSLQMPRRGDIVVLPVATTSP